MKKLFWVILLAFLTVSLEKYTVHVLPHSHDDPGWIKTFDEYFNQKVMAILNNTVESLIENPNRTFVYSEVSFFKKWYESADKQLKKKVKTLIAEGRFDFVNGGFVMEDEADSHFIDAMNQLRLGFEFLKKEFGITPHIGWFLDQFGHSMSHGYLYTQFGFDKVVFGRSPQSLKNNLYKTSDLELMWHPFGKNETGIFTHVIYGYFCPPSSIISFIGEKKLQMNENSLRTYATKFLNEIRKEMKGYKHNHYMLYYGCDFAFVEKDANFFNIEKLMEYMNKNYPNEVELIYSTPEKYFKTIEKEIEASKLAQYSKDFLPYVDQNNHIWTGYFTSRPYLKGKIRESSILLSISSKFATEYFLNENRSGLSKYFHSTHAVLQEGVALNQHHDAVTGTAKTYVSNDYIEILKKGDQIVQDEISKMFNTLFNEKGLKVCLSNNKVMLGCNIGFQTNRKKMVLGIYNPGFDGDVLFNIETGALNENLSFEIYDSFEKKVNHEIYCVPSYKCFILFTYKLNKAYSILSFSIRNISRTPTVLKVSFKNLPESTVLNVNNTRISKLTYSKPNKFQVEYANGKNYTFSVSHGKYTGALNGAYLFSTNEQFPTKYNIDEDQSSFIKGKESFAILIRTTNSYILLVIHNKPFFISTISVLDMVPKGYKKGDNVVLMVESDINNNIGEYYTDSNGLLMVKREIPSNAKTGESFYPVSKAIGINDNNSTRKIVLFNDRPQGGSSKAAGSIYLMLNRWSTKDDYKGLGEKLYEPQSTGNVYCTQAIIMISDEEKEDLLVKKIANLYFEHSVIMFHHKNTIGGIEQQKYYKFGKLSDIFVYDEGIRMDILYVSEERAIVQFYNESDEYFGIDDENYGNISLLLSRKYNLKLCDVNGFNCKEIQTKRKKYSNVRNGYYSNYISYYLNPLEIKVFEITFN